MCRHRPQSRAMHTKEGAKTLCSGSYKLFNKTLFLRTNYNLVSFVGNQMDEKPTILLSQLGQIRSQGRGALPLGRLEERARDGSRNAPRHAYSRRSSASRRHKSAERPRCLFPQGSTLSQLGQHKARRDPAAGTVPAGTRNPRAIQRKITGQMKVTPGFLADHCLHRASGKFAGQLHAWYQQNQWVACRETSFRGTFCFTRFWAPPSGKPQHIDLPWICAKMSCRADNTGEPAFRALRLSFN